MARQSYDALMVALAPFGKMREAVLRWAHESNVRPDDEAMWQHLSASFLAGGLTAERVEEAVRALPTNPEWAKAASWAAWFSKAMTEAAASISRWALATAIFVAAVVLASIITAYGSGFSSGWRAERAQNYWSATAQACAILDHARHDIAIHHADAHALRVIMTQHGCD